MVSHLARSYIHTHKHIKKSIPCSISFSLASVHFMHKNVLINGFFLLLLFFVVPSGYGLHTPCKKMSRVSLLCVLYFKYSVIVYGLEHHLFIFVVVVVVFYFLHSRFLNICCHFSVRSMCVYSVSLVFVLWSASFKRLESFLMAVSKIEWSMQKKWKKKTVFTWMWYERNKLVFVVVLRSVRCTVHTSASN